MRPIPITWSLLLATLSLLPIACDQGKPNDHPEEQAEAERRATTQPAPISNVEINDPLAPMKKRADGGDISAMITLGRTYESLGTPAGKQQARQWYEKAAAKGDASALEALHNMETAATREAVASAPETDPTAQALAATTKPSAGFGSLSASTSPPTTGATTRDLSRLSWREVVNTLNTKDWVNIANPSYTPKRGVVPPAFVGLSTAPDKTITVAGSGPSENDIQAVSLVIRVRNRADLADNNRVIQASMVANTVTRNNVGQKEFIDWVGQYLANGIKSEPIFRNGWRVQISGTAGEGMRDPKEYLGTAVLVEMRR